MYEESAKVPFIISKIGQWNPRADNMLVCNGTDIIPTICGFARIEKPVNLKGADLSQKIKNPSISLRDKLVIETDFADNQELLNISGRAVMANNLKYIVYNRGTIKEQLFDLKKDPGEITNLAVSGSYKNNLETMRGFLKKCCNDNGDKFGADL